MNNQELVSIVMPTYNRAYLLPRAIESALGQTYQNIELVIVDDGSKDNTEQVVKDYRDPRIRYIRNAINRGIAASRNTGIKNSKGNFITFLESDDKYLPEKVERSMQVFLSCNNRMAMVASNYFIINGDNESIAVIKPYKIKRLFPHISSWVLYKKVFEEAGLFDERITISSDIDFFSRFRKIFSFYFIEKPLLSIYRLEDGAFSDTQKVISIRKQYLSNLRADRRLYAQNLKYLGKDYLQIGEEKQASKCFLSAFVAYPVKFSYLMKFFRYYIKA